jgi:acid phosphatase
MDNDDFHAIPSNISTVVDLLDTKGISWAEYQEDIPYAGFQGFNFSNQKTFANDYVRKHNPLILFDSVTNNATRRSLIKNFTSFASDLATQKLPQWSFVTPNMTNDGHDTNVSFAAKWARNNLTPLLNDSYFTNDTLIVLTFDEDETYNVSNKVYTILLGGVIPASLKGTIDATFYTHYSMLSTVSVNWGLPSLGRWDCGANVLQLVANKTGYVNSAVDTANLYFNSSYPGPMADAKYIPTWPSPDTLSQCASGQGVLGAVASTWGKGNGTYNYTNVFPYDAASGNNVGAAPVLAAFVTASSSSSSASSTPTGSATSTSTSTGSGTSASPSSSGAESGLVRTSAVVVLGVAALVALMLL